MKNAKDSIIAELDLIQHIGHDIDRRKDRQSLLRSVKRIRQKLNQLDKREWK